MSVCGHRRKPRRLSLVVVLDDVSTIDPRAAFLSCLFCPDVVCPSCLQIFVLQALMFRELITLRDKVLFDELLTRRQRKSLPPTLDWYVARIFAAMRIILLDLMMSSLARE